MVALKKQYHHHHHQQQLSLSRADFDWRASKGEKGFAGFIFVCNNSTFPDPDCKVFGLPGNYADSVSAIRKGMPLFLYNYSNRRLHGVFEAASDGGFNIEPHAWGSFESNKYGRKWNPVSRYPAQVRVQRRAERSPLEDEDFRRVLDHIDGYKFRLELNAHQVQRLLSLFDSPPSCSERERRRGPFFPAATDVQEPGSPRSIKSDSDCCSESSSRGTNSAEEEWTHEPSHETSYYGEADHDGALDERLSHLSLLNYNDDVMEADNPNSDKDLLYNASFVMGGSIVSDDQFNENDGCGHVLRWKGSSTGRAANGSREEASQDRLMLLRLQDADPAVNSSSFNEPVHVNMKDNVMAMSVLTSQVPSHFSNGENIIFIPVRTVPCQQQELPTQSPRLKWNDQKKHSRGWSNSRKQSSSRDGTFRTKDVRHHKQQPSDSQPHLQISQVLVPICTQRQGQLHDQGQMATFISQLLVPPNSEGISFVHPHSVARGTAEDTDEGFERAGNDEHALSDNLQQILQRGHVLLMPQMMPRVQASPPPIERGFVVEALHSDVLHFARSTRPSAETQRHVKAAIDCVRKGVKMVWPEADIEVFGSFATGLCLQHSDVDLAVVDAPCLPSSEKLSIAQASASLIRELASALRSYDWCEMINPLDTASMPVLKCFCRPFGSSTTSPSSIPSIAIDITIGGMRNSEFMWSPERRNLDSPDQVLKLGNFTSRHTGGAAREYVLHKIQELPALAPLVLLLKSFLHHRNLSNVYFGGLGSFSLTLLLAFYLERLPISRGVIPEANSTDSPVSSLPLPSPPTSCPSETSDDSELQSPIGSYSSFNGDSSSESLGEHYVRRAADVIERVLSLWDSGGSPSLGTLLLGFLQTFGFQLDLSGQKIVLEGLDGSPGGRFLRDDRHVALWIDDPLRPGVNVGAGSFAMVRVQAAFKEMLQVLTNQSHSLASPVQCSQKDCRDLAVMGGLQSFSRMIMDDADY